MRACTSKSLSNLRGVGSHPVVDCSGDNGRRPAASFYCYCSHDGFGASEHKRERQKENACVVLKSRGDIPQFDNSNITGSSENTGKAPGKHQEGRGRYPKLVSHSFQL